MVLRRLLRLGLGLRRAVASRRKDCGAAGSRAGDSGCTKPGAGLAKPRGDGRGNGSLHENSGRRNPARLARALVITGAPKAPPKARRPASLPGPREPGDQVCVDVLDVFDAIGARFSVLHAVDGVTKFQMATLVEHKSSAEVIRFLRERWAPVFGMPRTLVCDQGREFISHELEGFAAECNMFLCHIAVQALRQNGLCERVGGILKTMLAACTASQSLMGRDEMSLGLGEATTACNMAVGDSGFSPMQAAVGRQPLLPGDALRDNPVEGEAREEPAFARLVAIRETARTAMLRLHFSRALRKAELARSRNPTVASAPVVGDLVYFWREQKYNRKGNRDPRRMSLRKWHGPALLKGASREGLADKGGYGAPPPSLTHGTARIWRMAGSHQRSCRGGSNSLDRELLATLRRRRALESLQVQRN